MNRIERWLPGVLTLLFGIYFLTCFRPPYAGNAFDLNGFGELPVLNGGRIKPLDTIARSSLLMLSGKQTVRVGDHDLPALDWLIQVMFEPAKAAPYPVFEIDNPDVLGILGIQQTQQRRFPYTDLEPKLAEIERQGTQAEQVKPDQRSRFQTAVLNLQSAIILYQRLRNTLEVSGSQNQIQNLQRFAHIRDQETFMRELERYHFMDQAAEFYPLPLHHNPGSERQWVSIGRSVLTLARGQTDTYHPGLLSYAAMSDAWRAKDATAFNAALHLYRSWLAQWVPLEVLRTRYEYLFNYVEPFYQSLLIYLSVFLIVFCSWIVWPKIFNRSAYNLLILAFTVHTFGLFSRILLQGRPPVTNLYSSAIFVGWVAVLLGIVLERLYRNGIGSMVASVIGFITLIIAHHLASTGDTLEMMRAVLDSNFWLATHVVSITVGYGSTFVSGFLATVYLFRRIFDPRWNKDLAKTFERMVYGIVCFSTLFSFVGTILGGIWADQSWGRFWGWDPKENGALMIVLWNVFILHARWGKYADGENLMLLAVVGNIVTALSWFGVNMLGIGLHSYGFMDKAFVWLLLFIASQLVIILLGFLHPKLFRRRT